MEQFSIFLYSAMQLHNFNFNVLSKKIKQSAVRMSTFFRVGPVLVLGLGEDGCD